MLLREVERLPLLPWGPFLSLCLKVEALCNGTRFVVEMTPLFHSVPANVIPNCNLSLICCSVFSEKQGRCYITF